VTARDGIERRKFPRVSIPGLVATVERVRDFNPRWAVDIPSDPLLEPTVACDGGCGKRLYASTFECQEQVICGDCMKGKFHV
jgi:hypothetical protein